MCMHKVNVQLTTTLDSHSIIAKDIWFSQYLVVDWMLETLWVLIHNVIVNH